MIGVDYDTSSNFPADDTGHGFDNIGDVLSLSPLLLEKYVNASREIVSSVVPVVSGIVREETLAGDQFRLDAKTLLESLSDDSEAGRQTNRTASATGTVELSYYEKRTVRAKLKVADDGDYVLRLNVNAKETYVNNQFDENKCESSFAIGDDVLLQREFV